MKILFNDNHLLSFVRFRLPIAIFLLKQGHSIIILAPIVDEADKILRSEIPEDVLFLESPLKRSSKAIKQDLKYIVFIQKVLHAQKPDLVFNYTIKPNIFGSILSYFNRIPCCAMVAGLGYSFSNRSLTSFLARNLYRLALKCANYVFFLNEDNLKLSQELKLCSPQKQVFFQGGEGVDIEDYPYTDNESPNNIFLFVARLIREKGYYDFVSAAKMVKAKYPQTLFWVAGVLENDRPNAISRERIARDEVGDLISYLGVVTDMKKLYSTPGIVMVIPSYYSEGLNRSLMEACSAGKPIITTNLPGCKETVVEGYNGWLVSPKDPQTLADTMIRYVELSPEEKKQLSINSRNHAVNHFSIDNVKQKYIEIIKTISTKKKR